MSGSEVPPARPVTRPPPKEPAAHSGECDMLAESELESLRLTARVRRASVRITWQDWSETLQDAAPAARGPGAGLGERAEAGGERADDGAAAATSHDQLALLLLPKKQRSTTDLQLIQSASLLRDGYANDREKARLDALLNDAEADDDDDDDADGGEA